MEGRVPHDRAGASKQSVASFQHRTRDESALLALINQGETRSDDKTVPRQLEDRLKKVRITQGKVR